MCLFFYFFNFIDEHVLFELVQYSDVYRGKHIVLRSANLSLVQEVLFSFFLKSFHQKSSPL